VTFTAGKVGNAATMVAASSQYLSVSNAALQTGAVDFWVSAWGKVTNTANGQTYVGKGWTGTDKEFTLQQDSGFYKFYCGGDTNTVVGPAVADTNYHHLFAWRRAATSLIYLSLDGAAAAVAGPFAAPPASAALFTIGTLLAPGPVQLLDGQVDCVGFGKPPTDIGDGSAGTLAAEIRAALYNGGAGKGWP
jgi:hypothetical protein